MKSKTIVRVLAAILFVFLLIYFFQSALYRIHSSAHLDKDTETKLLSTAATALQSSDVPVGAVLLYNDSILSTGFNTVLRDSDVGRHAEINAISSAISKTGFKAFSKLDRNKLVLVSTFEPCMMCRGAAIEYNIRHVLFMKDKGIFHWLRSDAKQLRYEWNKVQCEGEEKQDSLFRLHPMYNYKL